MCEARITRGVRGTFLTQWGTLLAAGRQAATRCAVKVCRTGARVCLARAAHYVRRGRGGGRDVLICNGRAVVDRIARGLARLVLKSADAVAR